MLKNNINIPHMADQENIKKKAGFWSTLIDLLEMVIALIGAFFNFIFWMIFLIFIIWIFITVL